MSKLRTMPDRHEQHTRQEEFHEKLERGAETADLHRRKTHHDEQEALSPAAGDRSGSTPLGSHNRSQAARFESGSDAPPRKQPTSQSNTGEDPGALLKR